MASEGRQLDIDISKALGYTNIVAHEENGHTDYYIGEPKPENLVPYFCIDHNLINTLEQKVKERGLHVVYADLILKMSPPELSEVERVWWILHLPARVKEFAALGALNTQLT